MTERKRRLYRAVITAAPDGWVPLMLECSQLVGSGALISDRDQIVTVRLPSGSPLAFAPADLVDPVPYSADPNVDDGPRERHFYVGQSRTFLSRSAVENRAAIWRAHGCTVRVDIVWPELCAFCLEPVASHTEAEAASCQIDLRSAP